MLSLSVGRKDTMKLGSSPNDIDKSSCSICVIPSCMFSCFSDLQLSIIIVGCIEVSWILNVINPVALLSAFKGISASSPTLSVEIAEVSAFFALLFSVTAL